MTSPLPRTAPEAQGIPAAAIAEFIAQAEAKLSSLHSFMLLRHGAVVAEGWWHPYRPEVPHMLFSLSKSFTSTAVGLAVSEGRLAANDPVLKFFPAEAPRKVEAHLAAMQVRHLLSMSTGHDQDTTDRIMAHRNPVKAFLALPVEHAPGTHFVYNSGASYMLAAIVQSLTGQTLLDYLTPRLLAPLGIEGAVWESHPITGVNFGGWGLNIKTEDIARFGQLYLQRGRWGNQQVVPAEWVEAASAWQISNGDDPASDWAQGYGFHFWRCRHNIYRGDGAFGQYCLVMPQQEAVLAMTAGLADMQVPLNIVWETLLPAMGAQALPADEAADQALAQTQRRLRLAPPAGATSSPTAARVSGRTFSFDHDARPGDATARAGILSYHLLNDPERLKSLTVDFAPAAGTLTYRPLSGGSQKHEPLTVTFGYGQWVEGRDTSSQWGPKRITASGVWTAEDTLVITICAYETPFTLTLILRFAGDEVAYQSKVNVAFGPTEGNPVVGRVQKK